jgi:hypothetical protein
MKKQAKNTKKTTKSVVMTQNSRKNGTRKANKVKTNKHSTTKQKVANSTKRSGQIFKNSGVTVRETSNGIQIYIK